MFENDKFFLFLGISEFLAGRAVYLPLHPFTRRGFVKSIDTEPFLLRFFKTFELLSDFKLGQVKSKEIIRGGMPSLCLNKSANPFFWFKGYEQTYLERDIRELSRVADLLPFRNALQLAALRTGQVLKISELASDAKLNSTTMTRYLNLAETSFVLRRMPSYLRNKSSRLIKSPKVYVSDSGLACHLAGIKDLETESNEPLRGAMIETNGKDDNLA